MERKRKLPARAARVEGVNKKRTSTTPEQRTQTPAAPTPPPIIEETLPRTLLPGKPLPTLNEPQPEDLSSKEYQSVSERLVICSLLFTKRDRKLICQIAAEFW